ncbi:MAG: hypothetical protein ACE5JV_00325 [Nitrososphaerales archaeon]
MGKSLDELLSKGLIFEEKKRGTITYWTKESYMQHLMDNDPKFRLIYDIYSKSDRKISNRLSQIKTDLNGKVAGMVAEATAPSLVKNNGSDNGKNGNHPTLDQFKMEFDRTMAETTTSIGWVELGTIREMVCNKYEISKHDFYTLASQLFDQFNNRYELSTGGSEGVVLRGLLHGFVRRI